MKNGEKTVCPHCNEETFVKQAVEMEGWTKKGEIFVCALCGKKLADVQSEKNESCDQPAESKLSRLQSLLGGESIEKISTSLDQQDRRFCKDCIHAVKNAFIIRCGLSGKNVEPMDDCEKFQHRTEDV